MQTILQSLKTAAPKLVDVGLFVAFAMMLFSYVLGDLVSEALDLANFGSPESSACNLSQARSSATASGTVSSASSRVEAFS